jgi:RNA polymerase sigma factor (sigma-70 family)
MDDESLEHIERLDEFEGVKVALSAGLPSLGPSTAEALRLRVLEGLSYADVSKQLGCSVGAARVRVARGLQKLARKLEAEA